MELWWHTSGASLIWLMIFMLPVILVWRRYRKALAAV
jgi:hypothetical protein